MEAGKAVMAEAWSRDEVEAAVADYFSMLSKDLRGESYSKAAHNRGLQTILRGRSRGSVERKHQNISAILLEHGYPYIDGYKPLGNYQELLRVVVEERLGRAGELEKVVAAAVAATVGHPPAIPDLLAIEIAVPQQ